jgi:serine/threonine protein kinase
VPAELDEICLKALAAAKDDRYADCDEMRMALQGWLAANAPTTDGTRMAAFLQELFSEDIVRERAERQEMIARVRTRALTMPPTDELRQLIEKSDKVDIAALGTGDTSETPVRKPGSVGRRASDKGIDGNDRRATNDRRGDRARSAPTGESGAAATALAQKPDVVELDIGSEVDGRYKIVELIGEGGMGKVYLAEHVEIGKRVALKVLHPSYSRMPDLVERFRREARAASKIGHPNIVDVTDSGATPDGSVYFVMEYLEGVELGSIIEREGALDVARALRITGQICRALSAAHREGIIHRDLKPENIFLITRGGEADVVKVLDFGIAKTTEAEAARERRLTSPGMAMGTPEYMAPEQAAGRPADARTDIYSLGAIMYEMVTGVPPYTGDNFMEILTKKATQDPPPPVSVRAELPAQVSDLVMAAMSRGPDGRPQSMDALEYELNKCLSGRGVAVAQILGMTTDANVVATLNPGLSMRTFDDAMVRTGATRAGTHSDPWEQRSGVGRDLWETRSGVSRSMSGQSSGSIQRPTSEPSAPQSRPSGPLLPRAQSPAIAAVVTAPTSGQSAAVGEVVPDVKKRGGMAVFGWIMLVLIILGGVGAAAYVMFLKPTGKDAASVTPGSDTGSDTGSGASVVTPPANGSDEKPPAKPKHEQAVKSPATTENAGSADAVSGSNALEGSDEEHGTGKNAHGHTVRPHQPAAHHVTTAAEEKDPKALLKQGQALEASADWDEARQVYTKLEKLRGYEQLAEYRMAYDAFQSSDTNAAQAYAQKAATRSGAQKLDALSLYGDALFKNGEYKRAKEVYIAVRAKVTGDKKAGATKKIAACNGKLGLSERDGIKD